jgi:hypothetical protein
VENAETRSACFIQRCRQRATPIVEALYPAAKLVWVDLFLQF